jgi:predicted Zn-dependent peptidase
MPAEEPARYTGGERRVEKPLEQAHFALAFEAPGYRDDDYHAAQIAAVALGGGMSSRLFQEAREKRGLCYTIFAQGSAWSETGMMTIYAGTGGDELGQLVDLTADELSRAVRDFDEVEIARARAQTKAGLVMGLESPSARAERMAALLSIWGRVIPLEETIARFDAVDARRAREALARIVASRPAMALYGPVARARAVDDFAARLAA